MRVIDRVMGWAGRKLMAGLDPLNDRYYQPSGVLFSSAAGYPVSEESALKVSAVWRCVRLISEALAMLPVQVKRGSEIVQDHPVSLLMKRRPNMYQTAATFKRTMQRRALLLGNGYAEIMRGGMLVPIDNAHVLKTELLENFTVRYTIQQPLKAPRYLYRGRDMLHVMGCSTDGLTGLSVIGYMRQSVGANLAMEEHGAKVFSNGVRPSMFLTRPAQAGGKGMSEPLRAGIEASVNAANSGNTRAHRAIVLEDGMTATIAQFNNEDSQFLESRRFGVTDIARWFGVPSHMVNDTEKTTSWGSGIEQMSTEFVTYGLMPWAEEWEQALEMAFLDDDESVKFNFNGLLRGDSAARASFYQIMRNVGAMTANQVAEREDLPRRTDPGGDSYQDTPNGASPNAFGAPRAPQPEPDPEDDATEGDDSED